MMQRCGIRLFTTVTGRAVRQWSSARRAIREEEAAMVIGDPWHVGIVTETYPPEINGVAMTLARLVDGLRERGHLVSLVRPRQHATDRPDPRDPTVTVVPGLPVPGYAGVRIGLPAGPILSERWTRCRPDVLYVATEGPLGWSALRTAGRLQVPVLSGFHTNFQGYAKHYHARLLAPVVARGLRRFHNRTGATLVATEDLRDSLEAHGFRNLRVLGRGVDRRLFTPERRSAALRRSWGVSDTDLAVLHVGRVAPEKNVALAIESYRAMQRGGRGVRCVVVGDGPARAALQEIHRDVHFCGVLTGERLAAHYASADVFLFPSQTETFGNVTLEALASGLAVVACDQAAARTHITHGVNGLLVRPGDARAFVGQAATLARAPALVARLRREARPSVAHLDWERVVERFEALLGDAARPRAARDLAPTHGGDHR
jgi:glycosyltransferase involved in cell wall biosynthesis